MMVGKEEVDHEHVSLFCSTNVGSRLVRLVCTVNRFKIGWLTKYLSFETENTMNLIRNVSLPSKKLQ